MTKLTDAHCRNARVTNNRPRRMFDAHGLYLEIHPNGRKTWYQKYRTPDSKNPSGKKEKRLTHGRYPDVSLEEARKKCTAALKLIREGNDPAVEKKNAKRQQLIDQEQTVERCFREWHKNKEATWDQENAKKILRSFEKDIFSEIGFRPIKELKAKELLVVLEKIKSRGAHHLAKRCLQYCSQAIRYAVMNEWCERNVADDLKGALGVAPKKHYPSIDPSEISNFVSALDRNENDMYRQTYLAIKLLMLTALRPHEEFAKGKWSEINFEEGVWIIPKERMKMGNEHIVPLSRQAIELLKEIKKLNGYSHHIFCGRNDSRKQLSDNTILKALYAIGYKGKMTPHGFRSLMMSVAKEKLGYRHEVPDRQLAHVPEGEVNKAYDRAKFLPERKKMMQEYADYIDHVCKKS